MRLAAAVLGIPCHVIDAVAARELEVVCNAVLATACREFPFGIGQQAVLVARKLPELAGETVRVEPAYADFGSLVRFPGVFLAAP